MSQYRDVCMSGRRCSHSWASMGSTRQCNLVCSWRCAARRREAFLQRERELPKRSHIAGRIAGAHLRSSYAATLQPKPNTYPPDAQHFSIACASMCTATCYVPPEIVLRVYISICARCAAQVVLVLLLILCGGIYLLVRPCYRPRRWRRVRMANKKHGLGRRGRGRVELEGLNSPTEDRLVDEEVMMWRNDSITIT